MPDSQAAETRASGISAAAHLLQLEPGVYCVTHAPGTPGADPATGLPGVRVSPGPGTFAGQVTLCGFSADGWLGRGDDAVMIRVSGGAAQVMVTIYRGADESAPAPQLQVVRLSGLAAAAAPVRAPEVMAHVLGSGDVSGRLGEWMGERGSRRWVEGFALAPEGVALEYQAVLGRDWMSPWSQAGEFCGSRGMSLPILGLCVRLREDAAEGRTLRVWATFVDGSTAGPVGSGEACRAESLAALEAFRVEIVAAGKRGARRAAKRG